MKTLKISTSILALLLISCKETPQQENNQILEKKQNTIIETPKTLNQNNEDWIKKVQQLQQLKEGEKIETTTNSPFQNKSKPQLDLLEYWANPKEYSQKYKEPTLQEFEYSDHWRKEAYKATKLYIKKVINKKPNCKVTRQGSYQPYLLRYLGNFSYLVKIYCEFECKQEYNNPSYFFVEVHYKGFNIWDGKVIKQKMIN